MATVTSVPLGIGKPGAATAAAGAATHSSSTGTATVSATALSKPVAIARVPLSTPAMRIGGPVSVSSAAPLRPVGASIAAAPLRPVGGSVGGTGGASSAAAAPVSMSGSSSTAVPIPAAPLTRTRVGSVSSAPPQPILGPGGVPRPVSGPVVLAAASAPAAAAPPAAAAAAAAAAGGVVLRPSEGPGPRLSSFLWDPPGANHGKGKKKPAKKAPATRPQDKPAEEEVTSTPAYVTMAVFEVSGFHAATSASIRVAFIDGKMTVQSDSLVVTTGPSASTDHYAHVDETDQFVTSASFANRTHAERWTDEETITFFKALRQCGSDFNLIQQTYFPTRTRQQVKNKFKKEERWHRHLVDKALACATPFCYDDFKELSVKAAELTAQTTATTPGSPSPAPAAQRKDKEADADAEADLPDVQFGAAPKNPTVDDAADAADGAAAAAGTKPRGRKRGASTAEAPDKQRGGAKGGKQARTDPTASTSVLQPTKVVAAASVGASTSGPGKPETGKPDGDADKKESDTNKGDAAAASDEEGANEDEDEEEDEEEEEEDVDDDPVSDSDDSFAGAARRLRGARHRLGLGR